jgi:hypothetical protein
LLDKIRNEPTMPKWARLAQDAERLYFFSPGRQNKGRVTFPFPSVERGAEASGVFQKSAAVLEKPAA